MSGPSNTNATTAGADGNNIEYVVHTSTELIALALCLEGTREDLVVDADGQPACIVSIFDRIDVLVAGLASWKAAREADAADGSRLWTAKVTKGAERLALSQLCAAIDPLVKMNKGQGGVRSADVTELQRRCGYVQHGLIAGLGKKMAGKEQPPWLPDGKIVLDSQAPEGSL